MGVALVMLVALAPIASGETWHLVPELSIESTFTDNVDLTPVGKSDWVNQFTPSIRFREVGARTRLNGVVSVPVLLYARTPHNNEVFPQANIFGTLEAVDNFLFIDASADVSQQYVTPFGAQSTSLANATQNRYTSQTYRIDPYIKGEASGDISYELRDNNTWTDAGGTARDIIGNSYGNEIVGHLVHRPTPAGWALEYDRNEVRYSNEESQVMEIGRGRAIYRLSPTIEVSASAGYEDNRFFHLEESGLTYGASFRWHPTRHTNLNALWEHRFFGSSYDVSFDHTTPLSVWSIRASRNITSYPQQLGTLVPGVQVSGLLDALFATRIPDTIQRQIAVDELIRERGLPAVLSGPVPLLTQRVTLLEAETATMGLLGARNSVFLTAFRSRSRPVEDFEGSMLATLLANINVDNTQVGAAATWTHRLPANMTFGTNLDWSHVTDHTELGATTRIYSVRALLSKRLSAITSVYTGARYQNLHSDLQNSYREAAVFVGLTHTFH